jgi:hypothetical protein
MSPPKGHTEEVTGMSKLRIVLLGGLCFAFAGLASADTIFPTSPITITMDTSALQAETDDAPYSLPAMGFLRVQYL